MIGQNLTVVDLCVFAILCFGLFMVYKLLTHKGDPPGPGDPGAAVAGDLMAAEHWRPFAGYDGTTDPTTDPRGRAWMRR